MNLRYINLTGLVIIFSIIFQTSFSQDNNSHLNPPKIIKLPSSDSKYNPESRKFSGISSMAVSREGRLWAVWYAGITPAEDTNNYVVLSTSGDNGATWEEVLAVDPDGPGPVRAYDPEVWRDPDGKLWVFWAQHIQPVKATNCGVWAMTTTEGGSAGAEWSAPERISDGVMMCKPVVLSDGTWALPVSFWQMTEKSAKMVASSDKGETWQVRGGVDVPESVRNYDEHMIVERKNGSLWMLVRTNYGIGESISTDHGYSWSPLIPSRIQHPPARFFISRLNSGNLLLVKHGPVDMKTGRSHLMAFISEDDGYSWTDGLLIDGRTGVSYPDGQQTADGKIWVTYDYNRTKDQNILMTTFTEDDILSGSSRKIMEVFQSRRIISKGGEK